MKWHKLGYSPNQFPKLWYGGRLLIVCGGHTVWDDIEKVKGKFTDTMCVNDIIMHFPYKITHAYSNDFRMLNNWVAARRPRYKFFDDKIITHSNNECEGAYKWPFKENNSGLNAILVGRAMYDEVYVAGMPLDNGPHYFNPKPSRFLTQVPDQDLAKVMNIMENITFIGENRWQQP